ARMDSQRARKQGVSRSRSAQSAASSADAGSTFVKTVEAIRNLAGRLFSATSRYQASASQISGSIHFLWPSDARDAPMRHLLDLAYLLQSCFRTQTVSWRPLIPVTLRVSRRSSRRAWSEWNGLPGHLLLLSLGEGSARQAPQPAASLSCARCFRKLRPLVDSRSLAADHTCSGAHRRRAPSLSLVCPVRTSGAQTPYPANPSSRR